MALRRSASSRAELGRFNGFLAMAWTSRSRAIGTPWAQNGWMGSLEDPDDDGRRCLSVEGTERGVPGQEQVERRGQFVDVRGRRGGQALEHLGRRVEGVEADHTRCVGGGAEPGHPEVRQRRFTVVHQQLARGDRSMDDAGPVRRFERTGDLDDGGDRVRACARCRPPERHHGPPDPGRDPSPGRDARRASPPCDRGSRCWDGRSTSRGPRFPAAGFRGRRAKISRTLSNLRATDRPESDPLAERRWPSLRRQFP